MKIIDFQLHEPAPREGWDDVPVTVRRRVLTEMMLQSLDDLGVDAAILYPMEDSDWALELTRRFPARFAMVTMLGSTADRMGIDLGSPTLEEDIRTARERGIVGLRIGIAAQLAPDSVVARFAEGGYDRALAICERYQVPVFLFCWGNLATVERPARMFPGLQLVIDHIGLTQPPFQEADIPAWKALPELLRLSALPNIAVKLCGAPVLSQEAYPFADIWPHVESVIEAFGAQRVAWASDIQRFRARVAWNIRHPVASTGDYPGKHTYREALSFILDNERLSHEDKVEILGGTARRIHRWPAGSHH